MGPHFREDLLDSLALHYDAEIVTFWSGCILVTPMTKVLVLGKTVLSSLVLNSTISVIADV
jgi:hypothetical protein